MKSTRALKLGKIKANVYAIGHRALSMDIANIVAQYAMGDGTCNQSFLILGTIGSGKKSLARHIMQTFEPEDVMVFCGSHRSEKAFQKFIRTDSIYCYIEFFPSALEELKAKLEVWVDAEYVWHKKEAKREPNESFRRPYPVKKPQKFFVFDDVSHYRHIFKHGRTRWQFEYLVHNAQHTGGYIMCCPNMTDLMPIARLRAMNVFFMNEPTPKMARVMFGEFGRGIPKKDFVEMLCYGVSGISGISGFTCVALCPVDKVRNTHNHNMFTQVPGTDFFTVTVPYFE